MRMGTTYWFSNSFPLEHMERDTLRGAGIIGILHSCWRRARNLETEERLSLASGLLQGDNYSGYHHRNQPDENRTAQSKVTVRAKGISHSA